MSDTKNQVGLELVTPPQSASPLSLIERMIDSGKLTAESVSVVERLVALQEKMLAKQAEQAFAHDFAALQSELGNVRATEAVTETSGNVRYFYVSFESLKAQTRSVMTKYGFADTYSADYKDGRIAMTCTLLHRGGHSRANTVFIREGKGPPGTNDAQASGSTDSYGKRYAFLSALGLAVDKDTDARNEGTPLSPEQAQTLREMVAETKSDEAKFLRYAGAATFEEIGANRYDELFAALQKKLHP